MKEQLKMPENYYNVPVCPFCGREDYQPLRTPMNFELADDGVWLIAHMHCLACGRKWSEEEFYGNTGVMELYEEGEE